MMNFLNPAYSRIIFLLQAFVGGLLSLPKHKCSLFITVPFCGLRFSLVSPS
jgi:hypothetical protein